MTKTIDEMLDEIEGALSVSYEREQRFYAVRSTGAVVKDTQLGKALSTLTELRERLEGKELYNRVYKAMQDTMRLCDEYTHIELTKAAIKALRGE